MKFKGNLHVHTTRSDGKLDPKDCIELYKKQGYDFLAITDHYKLFPYADEYCDSTFTVFNGCELNYDFKNPNKSFHIVCLEPDDDFVPNRNITPNEATRDIVNRGGIAFLAHPAWSLMSFDDCLNLQNIIGIEIWNHISHAYSRRGHSGSYIDVCAASGKKILLLATDDAHFYDTDHFGGYIVVESPSLSKQDLLQSIKEGNFYCSQGPEIYRFEREGDIIVAQTSLVASMAFLSDALWAPDRVQSGKDGKCITQGIYTVKPNETYVRLECYDQEGKTAWSQILYL
jgi:hypothetical protein